jgi:hypothetical protein
MSEATAHGKRVADATSTSRTAEHARLADADAGRAAWRRFGPFLSDRQWGTVREDYSADGAAWDSFPHEHARSRAYRWGEDGLAGFCDREQLLCLSLALWNGRDPILKERLFGLTNGQGNHGEDVKELYWFLDALPSGALARMLYKYPQRRFPYDELVRVNAARSKLEREFEILDTGVFDDDRYFDVEVEYAKAAPDDILMTVTITNRSPEAAPIHVLPTIVWRNTWSWTGATERPVLRADGKDVLVQREGWSAMRARFDGAPQLLFCENDTNTERLFGKPRDGRTFKDGINDCVISGAQHCVAASHTGTKMSAHYVFEVPAGASVTVRMRLVPDGSAAAFNDFDAVRAARAKDADEFFGSCQIGIDDAELRLIQRQAWAGLLWSQQVYHFDVARWIDGDRGMPPPPPNRRLGRNAEWRHLENDGVYLMPDSWEYPWYAAWDLAFHCAALAPIDPVESKRQLLQLLGEGSMHSSGQMPAYEWAFGDVNPPVHAWAVLRILECDRAAGRADDLDFLRRAFHRLLLNFTWWVNRKDRDGRNLFAGGFLGLDNVGVFDRSADLPKGATLQQADGTGWMGMFALNMMRLSTELAIHEPVYQDMAIKFFDHFLEIAGAMADFAGTGVGLWDEQDKFYYDRLRFEDGSTQVLRVQSVVGLLPMTAVSVMHPSRIAQLPVFSAHIERVFATHSDLAKLVSHWNVGGSGDLRLFSLLRGHRMKCLLKRMLNEQEFLSPYGVRSMSRALEDNPFVFWHDGKSMDVRYSSGESITATFGGNSNWRGPIWMPVNYLFIESLKQFHAYYGDEFKIECPVGSGKLVTLDEAGREVARRLLLLFRRDASGTRPCLAEHPKLQGDPHFNDKLLFHEYFDGNTGRGCGASHQTGWTAMVVWLVGQLSRRGVAL